MKVETINAPLKVSLASLHNNAHQLERWKHIITAKARAEKANARKSNRRRAA